MTKWGEDKKSKGVACTLGAKVKRKRTSSAGEAESLD
jgi:hypothetical protein